jgi:predicted neutral ceramidase superfamily lipid hydrolase
MTSDKAVYNDPFNKTTLLECLVFLFILSFIWFGLDLYLLDDSAETNKGISSYFISVCAGLSAALFYLASVQRFVYTLNRVLQFLVALLFMVLLIISSVELALDDLAWFISNSFTMSFFIGVVCISKQQKSS